MANLLLLYDSQYRHKSLTSQDSIRLIKVVPELFENRNISCIVSEHALPQATNGPRVEYRALSYLWGDPTPSRCIYVRHETSEKWDCRYIHSNLWRFLAHMWRKEQFDCLLWTDCLCLNQDGQEEMAQQIPRMGLIYSQAESVIIWLGLSAWEENHFQEHREWIKHGGKAEPFNPWPERPPHQRLAVCSVQDHEYWKRMWIMQEVAMAQKVVVEMQDTPSFDLQELCQVMEGFRSINGEVTWRMMELIDIRGSRGTTPLEPKSSLEMLTAHCRRLCTLQQDHVYGLLGMVKQDDPIQQITIDYNKPASDVLFDALFTVTSPLHTTDETFALILALEDVGLMEDINSLEEYSNRDHSWKLTDNEVVKTFTRITLEVFDALHFIAATFGGCSSSYSCIKKVVSDIQRLGPPGADDFQWKAIIGVILAFRSRAKFEKKHEQWKQVRWPKFKAQSKSLWLCARHAPQLAPEDLHAEAIMPLTRHFRSNDIVKACRNYHEQGSVCDGSTMSLEVPDSGTRLELDYDYALYKQVDFKIWLKNGASGST